MFLMETNVVVPLAELFGKRIQQIRKGMHLTQSEFAELIGFHRTFIGQVERAEKNVTLKTIDQICKRLNMTIEELFDFSKLK